LALTFVSPNMMVRPDGSVDLPRFQILLWSLLSQFMFFYFYLLTGALNDIPTNLLAALGITIFMLLALGAIRRDEKDTPVVEKVDSGPSAVDLSPNHSDSF